MPDYRLAIPSRGRSASIQTATLATLQRGKVPRNRVTVWVTAADLPEYTAALPGWDVRDHGGPPGMAEARRAIASQYPVGTRLVQMDDDVRDVRALVPGIPSRRRGGTLAPVADLDALFDHAFAHARRAGVTLWGVYPVANAYFMQQAFRVGLQLVVGPLWGTTVAHDSAEELRLGEKEDFERTFRYYLRDGAVGRMENVTIDTRYYTEPGGMQLERTTRSIETAAHTLADLYPQFCTFRRSKTRGTAELRIRRLPHRLTAAVPVLTHTEAS